MIHTITANEIKTKGVNAISDATMDGDEAFISVRGQNRFVVFPIEKYNQLRECELELALLEVRKDIQNGKVIESIDEHIARMKNA